MIVLRNATKIYRNGNGGIIALDCASARIKQGDFAVVFGRSGAGKSTLLAVMGGLLRPSSGAVFLQGEPIWDLRERALARLRARRIGFVFQSAPVIRSLTAIENVLLPAAFVPGANGAGGRERARSLLERVGLGGRETAYPAQLSGGEVRRVAIAAALINGPSLLLADEPTGDLDGRTEAEVLALLAGLNREGMSIVLVTHNRGLAAYANRVFTMERGALSENGRLAGAQP